MITPMMRLFSLGLERVLELARKGELELTDEELLCVMRGMALEPLSKERAARYLNMRRSNFDTHVKKGHLPKGKKVAGFKELRWYALELDTYKATLRRK